MSVPHGPDSYYPQAQLQNVPRSAFLVWAILVALAVSALVFPKLPDTLGLSQEAGERRLAWLHGKLKICFELLSNGGFLWATPNLWRSPNRDNNDVLSYVDPIGNTYCREISRKTPRKGNH